MIYKEEQRDLFTVDNRYTLVHCISSDFAMGAGIAVQFAKMGVKNFLMETYDKDNWIGRGYCLSAKADDRFIFNLITKEKYWHKPTYNTLKQSLISMREHILTKQKIMNLGTLYLAMPRIGCGIDGLNWSKVSQIIKEVFKDIDVEILVCYL